MAEENNVVKVVKDNLRQLAQETTEMLMEKITVISKAVESQMRQTEPSVTAAPAGVNLKGLVTAIDVIKCAGNQNELTSAVLKGSKQFSSRAAIFVIRPDKVQGWQAIGVDHRQPENILDFKKVSVPLDDFVYLQELGNTQEAIVKPYEKNNITDYLMIQMGGKKPEQFFMGPLILRDKIIALLFADSLEGHIDRFAPDALKIMSEYASLVMEVLSTGRVLKKTKPGVEEPAVAAPPEIPAAEEVEVKAEPVRQVAQEVSLDSMDPRLRDLHEKAKRTARVIVSDIVLYNKAKIEDGIAKGNLQDLLKEEIERGRELYNAKVSPEVSDTTDYYFQTLVKTVAKGNPALLGL